MTSQTRATLKGYFNTNDQPTETQFADLIDSAVNIADSNSGAGSDGQALVWDYAAGQFVASATINKITATRMHAIYCIGDSITSGYGGTATGGYQSTLISLLGSPWLAKDRGVGGNTTAQMIARFTREIVTPGDAEYVCVLGGINSIGADVSAVSIETDLQNMYNLAHNAGVKVVAITIAPFGGTTGWTAPRQAVLDAVNAWILNTATNVDYRVDAYSALENPGVADALLPAYDSGDHLHLSNAGYVALGTAIYGGVTWTAGSTAATVKITGNAIINQDVSYGASPAFVNIATNVLRPQVDSTTGLLIQTASNGLTILSIDSTNKRVAVGATVPSGKLHIVGDADVPVLLLKGINGQTVDHIQAQRGYDGAVKFAVDSAFRMIVNGASTTYRFEVRDEQSQLSGENNGIFALVYGTPVSNSSAILRAAHFNFTALGAINYTGQLVGARAAVIHQGSGAVTEIASLLGSAETSTSTGSIATAQGALVGVGHTTVGTITSAIGLAAQIRNTGAGTIGAAYGTYIKDAVNSGGGAITTQYGIFIEAMTTGTTKYAIYTNAGEVRIGDIVNFAGTMGNSAKNPTTDAPADWVEIKIGSDTYYLPAYAAS